MGNKKKELETINKGLEFLRKDCSYVSFFGFIKENEIPKRAIKEEFDREEFSYEYIDTKCNGLDSDSFWGSIYLPFKDDIYMHFDVNS